MMYTAERSMPNNEVNRANIIAMRYSIVGYLQTTSELEAAATARGWALRTSAWI
jgi:hypothetical protein